MNEQLLKAQAAYVELNQLKQDLQTAFVQSSKDGIPEIKVILAKISSQESNLLNAYGAIKNNEDNVKKYLTKETVIENGQVKLEGDEKLSDKIKEDSEVTLKIGEKEETVKVKEKISELESRLAESKAITKLLQTINNSPEIFGTLREENFANYSVNALASKMSDMEAMKKNELLLLPDNFIGALSANITIMQNALQHKVQKQLENASDFDSLVALSTGMKNISETVMLVDYATKMSNEFDKIINNSDGTLLEQLDRINKANIQLKSAMPKLSTFELNNAEKFNEKKNELMGKLLDDLDKNNDESKKSLLEKIDFFSEFQQKLKKMSLTLTEGEINRLDNIKKIFVEGINEKIDSLTTEELLKSNIRGDLENAAKVFDDKTINEKLEQKMSDLSKITFKDFTEAAESLMNGNLSNIEKSTQLMQLMTNYNALRDHESKKALAEVEKYRKTLVDSITDELHANARTLFQNLNTRELVQPRAIKVFMGEKTTNLPEMPTWLNFIGNYQSISDRVIKSISEFNADLNSAKQLYLQWIEIASKSLEKGDFYNSVAIYSALGSPALYFLTNNKDYPLFKTHQEHKKLMDNLLKVYSSDNNFEAMKSAIEQRKSSGEAYLPPIINYISKFNTQLELADKETDIAKQQKLINQARFGLKEIYDNVKTQPANQFSPTKSFLQMSPDDWKNYWQEFDKIKSENSTLDNTTIHMKVCGHFQIQIVAQLLSSQDILLQEKEALSRFESTAMLLGSEEHHQIFEAVVTKSNRPGTWSEIWKKVGTDIDSIASGEISELAKIKTIFEQAFIRTGLTEKQIEMYSRCVEETYNELLALKPKIENFQGNDKDPAYQQQLKDYQSTYKTKFQTLLVAKQQYYQATSELDEKLNHGVVIQKFSDPAFVSAIEQYLKDIDSIQDPQVKQMFENFKSDFEQIKNLIDKINQNIKDTDPFARAEAIYNILNENSNYKVFINFYNSYKKIANIGINDSKGSLLNYMIKEDYVDETDNMGIWGVKLIMAYPMMLGAVSKPLTTLAGEDNNNFILKNMSKSDVKELRELVKFDYNDITTLLTDDKIEDESYKTISFTGKASDEITKALDLIIAAPNDPGTQKARAIKPQLFIENKATLLIDKMQPLVLAADAIQKKEYKFIPFEKLKEGLGESSTVSSSIINQKINEATTKINNYLDKIEKRQSVSISEIVQLRTSIAELSQMLEDKMQGKTTRGSLSESDKTNVNILFRNFAKVQEFADENNIDLLKAKDEIKVKAEKVEDKNAEKTPEKRERKESKITSFVMGKRKERAESKVKVKTESEIRHNRKVTMGEMKKATNEVKEKFEDFTQRVSRGVAKSFAVRKEKIPEVEVFSEEDIKEKLDTINNKMLDNLKMGNKMGFVDNYREYIQVFLDGDINLSVKPISNFSLDELFEEYENLKTVLSRNVDKLSALKILGFSSMDTANFQYQEIIFPAMLKKLEEEIKKIEDKQMPSKNLNKHYNTLLNSGYADRQEVKDMLKKIKNLDRERAAKQPSQEAAKAAAKRASAEDTTPQLNDIPPLPEVPNTTPTSVDEKTQAAGDRFLKNWDLVVVGSDLDWDFVDLIDIQKEMREDLPYVDLSEWSEEDKAEFNKHLNVVLTEEIIEMISKRCDLFLEVIAEFESRDNLPNNFKEELEKIKSSYQQKIDKIQAGELTDKDIADFRNDKDLHLDTYEKFEDALNEKYNAANDAEFARLESAQVPPAPKKEETTPPSSLQAHQDNYKKETTENFSTMEAKLQIMMENLTTPPINKDNFADNLNKIKNQIVEVRKKNKTFIPKNYENFMIKLSALASQNKDFVSAVAEYNKAINIDFETLFANKSEFPHRWKALNAFAVKNLMPSDIPFLEKYEAYFNCDAHEKAAKFKELRGVLFNESGNITVGVNDGGTTFDDLKKLNIEYPTDQAQIKALDKVLGIANQQAGYAIFGRYAEFQGNYKLPRSLYQMQIEKVFEKAVKEVIGFVALNAKMTPDEVTKLYKRCVEKGFENDTWKKLSETMKSQKASENITFLEAIAEYTKNPSDEKFQDIYAEFVSGVSPSHVNLTIDSEFKDINQKILADKYKVTPEDMTFQLQSDSKHGKGLSKGAKVVFTGSLNWNKTMNKLPTIPKIGTEWPTISLMNPNSAEGAGNLHIARIPEDVTKLPPKTRLLINMVKRGEMAMAGIDFKKLREMGIEHRNGIMRDFDNKAVLPVLVCIVLDEHAVLMGGGDVVKTCKAGRSRGIVTSMAMLIKIAMEIARNQDHANILYDKHPEYAPYKKFIEEIAEHYKNPVDLEKLLDKKEAYNFALDYLKKQRPQIDIKRKLHKGKGKTILDMVDLMSGYTLAEITSQKGREHFEETFIGKENLRKLNISQLHSYKIIEQIGIKYPSAGLIIDKYLGELINCKDENERIDVTNNFTNNINNMDPKLKEDAVYDIQDEVIGLNNRIKNYDETGSFLTKKEQAIYKSPNYNKLQNAAENKEERSEISSLVYALLNATNDKTRATLLLEFEGFCDGLEENRRTSLMKLVKDYANDLKQHDAPDSTLAASEKITHFNQLKYYDLFIKYAEKYPDAEKAIDNYLLAMGDEPTQQQRAEFTETFVKYVEKHEKVFGSILVSKLKTAAREYNSELNAFKQQQNVVESTKPETSSAVTSGVRLDLPDLPLPPPPLTSTLTQSDIEDAAPEIVNVLIAEDALFDADDFDDANNEEELQILVEKHQENLVELDEAIETLEKNHPKVANELIDSKKVDNLAENADVAANEKVEEIKAANRKISPGDTLQALSDMGAIKKNENGVPTMEEATKLIQKIQQQREWAAHGSKSKQVKDAQKQIPKPPTNVYTFYVSSEYESEEYKKKGITPEIWDANLYSKSCSGGRDVVDQYGKTFLTLDKPHENPLGVEEAPQSNVKVMTVKLVSKNGYWGRKHQDQNPEKTPVDASLVLASGKEFERITPDAVLKNDNPKIKSYIQKDPYTNGQQPFAAIVYDEALKRNIFVDFDLSKTSAQTPIYFNPDAYKAFIKLNLYNQINPVMFLRQGTTEDVVFHLNLPALGEFAVLGSQYKMAEMLAPLAAEAMKEVIQEIDQTQENAKAKGQTGPFITSFQFSHPDTDSEKRLDRAFERETLEKIFETNTNNKTAKNIGNITISSTEKFVEDLEQKKGTHEVFILSGDPRAIGNEHSGTQEPGGFSNIFWGREIAHPLLNLFRVFNPANRFNEKFENNPNLTPMDEVDIAQHEKNMEKIEQQIDAYNQYANEGVFDGCELDGKENNGPKQFDLFLQMQDLVAASHPKISNDDIAYFGNIENFDIKNRFDNFEKEFKKLNENFGNHNSDAANTTIQAYMSNLYQNGDKNVYREMRIALRHIRENARHENLALFEPLYARVKEQAPTPFEIIAKGFKKFQNFFVSPKIVKEMTDEVELENFGETKGESENEFDSNTEPQKYASVKREGNETEDLNEEIVDFLNKDDTDAADAEMGAESTEDQDEEIIEEQDETLRDTQQFLHHLDEKKPVNQKNNAEESKAKELFANLNNDFKKIQIPKNGGDLLTYIEKLKSADIELLVLLNNVEKAQKQYPNSAQFQDLHNKISARMEDIQKTIKHDQLEQKNNTLSLESNPESLSIEHLKDAKSSLYDYKDKKPRFLILDNTHKDINGHTQLQPVLEHEAKNTSYVYEQENRLEYIPSDDVEPNTQKAIIEGMVDKAVRKFGCENENELRIECVQNDIKAIVDNYLPNAIANYKKELAEAAKTKNVDPGNLEEETHISMKNLGGSE